MFTETHTLNPQPIALGPLKHLGASPFDGTSRLESLAFRHGATYDSYLATEPNRQVFYAQDVPGAVAYVQDGRYVHISGGLLARSDHKPELLADVFHWAQRERLTLSFYNLTDDELPLVRDFGFQVTKWGEEALVDLTTCTWSGKDYEWVRRQTNYCRRQQVVVRQCDQTQMSGRAWKQLTDELAEISRALMIQKPQRGEIRFLEGQTDFNYLGRRRLFVAQSNDGVGRIEGFLLCNPCLGGTRWVFETYRRRPDAIRGSMSYLMHQAMRQLQTEGVSSVSLCLMPGLRCETPLPGDSPLARWSMVLATRYFSFIHDTRGMYHFKSRFRPDFANRYLAVHPRLSLGSACSFVRVLGVLDLHPGHLLRQAWERLRSVASRRTLSSPELGY